MTLTTETVCHLYGHDTRWLVMAGPLLEESNSRPVCLACVRCGAVLDVPRETSTESKGTIMTIGVTAARSQPIHHRLEFWVDLDSDLVLTVHGSSYRGKEFKPERARLIYVPVGDGWKWLHMDVRGRALKKGGAVGALDVCNGYHEGNAPEWVRKIAEHFRPKQEAPLVADQPVTVAA
jgi:hypothetical protein